MPGLVDTHYQSSQYFRAGADQPSFFDFALNTFIPGTAMFANATFAREEAFKFVVCSHPYQLRQEDSCHWSKVNRQTYKFCPNSITIAVSEAERVAVNLVPVSLARFDYQWKRPSSSPFPW